MVLQDSHELNMLKVRYNDYCNNPLSANQHHGKTHSNNLSVTADELFECV